MTITRKLKKWLCAAVALCLTWGLWALPTHALDDFAGNMTRLARLQATADSYAAQGLAGVGALDLTLTHIRSGEYNTSLWHMIGGEHDAAFDEATLSADPDLIALQETHEMTLPEGRMLDLQHLMAAMQMVYHGMPVAGGWGGDIAKLAMAYLGQAQQAEDYKALMQANFAGGMNTVFSELRLRSDLDAVVLGAQLTGDTRLADLLQGYYTAGQNDHDRAWQFMALTFGNVDTADQQALRTAVYDTVLHDTGMQLLLYMQGMWQKEGWQITPEAEPAVRAACDLFADYLAAAVNGEPVTTDSEVRMTTVGAQALVDALQAIGDPEAAQAAAEAYAQWEAQPQPTPEPEHQGLDGFLYNLSLNLQNRFDANVFRAVLWVIGGLALLGLVVSLMLLAVEKIRDRED